MWRALALLVFLAQGARGETATVDGELAITSDWDGGFCGSLMTRNPASIPSTTWAGLFTFSGGTLTTGPNGNGVSKKITDTQWTFVPDDPAQMAIYPQSTVMATFCCDAENKADVQASFRVIYSFDTPGVGATDPLLPSPSPSPSLLAPSPAPALGPPAEALAPSPAANEAEGADSGAAAGSPAPAPAPESAGDLVAQQSVAVGAYQASENITLAVPTPTDVPATSSAGARSAGQAPVLMAMAAATVAAGLLG